MVYYTDLKTLHDSCLPLQINQEYLLQSWLSKFYAKLTKFYQDKNELSQPSILFKYYILAWLLSEPYDVTTRSALTPNPCYSRPLDQTPARFRAI